MEELINTLTNLNWYWYLIGLLIVVGFVFLLQYKSFKKVVLDLVTIAENDIIGTKRGQERFALVVSQIHNIIPNKFKWFFTEERIKNIIEWAVRKMKQTLEK